MALQSEIAALVKNVDAAAEAYISGGDIELNSQTRASSKTELLTAAKALVTALEDPEDEAWRFILHGAADACLNAAWHCGILNPWPQELMSSKELASMANADQKLVGESSPFFTHTIDRSLTLICLQVRMMRAIILYGIFKEVEEEVYTHNALSMIFSTPPMKQRSLRIVAQSVSTPISKLPEYLAKTSYRNPGDDPTARSMFQHVNNTDLEFFEWMQTQPDALTAFNTGMSNSCAIERTATGRGYADIYPFHTLEKDLSDPDEIVLVDVGGGYGHVLDEIKKRYPTMKGKMVLEDLAKTVEAHLPLENVDIVTYNFLTEQQPVIGARAYIMRHVLADWPDHICRQILKNTIPALVRGKSRILISETVLPKMNPPVFGSLMDVQMMKFGGSGRKEKMWRELFESVGLEVVKIWPPVKFDSIMELVLKV
jgi:O-methyltransferase domain